MMLHLFNDCNNEQTFCVNGDKQFSYFKGCIVDLVVHNVNKLVKYNKMNKSTFIRNLSQNNILALIKYK